MNHELTVDFAVAGCPEMFRSALTSAASTTLKYKSHFGGKEPSWFQGRI